MDNEDGIRDTIVQDIVPIVRHFTLVGRMIIHCKKAQWNFQLENHVTFHLIGIKIVDNVKIIYISTDIKLNSIEFTGFYIVHNVFFFSLYVFGEPAVHFS
jgi:hypothetical protein